MQAILLNVQVIRKSIILLMQTGHVFQEFYENCKEYKEAFPSRTPLKP